jgi:ATP-dependent RNA helicase DeaD
MVCTDEADEMLSMGFKDDMDAILATTPPEKQTLLFSATMPQEIMRIVKTYMNNPMEVAAEKVQTGADNVTHHYYEVQAKDRYVAVKRILDAHPDIYAIVFCRTRAETKEIAEKLSAEGYNSDAGMVTLANNKGNNHEPVPQQNASVAYCHRRCCART